MIIMKMPQETATIILNMVMIMIWKVLMIMVKMVSGCARL